MTEWIPLIQSLIWPVFIGLVLFLARKEVATVLGSLASRIERGDTVHVGGFSLESSEPKLTRLDAMSDAPEPSGGAGSVEPAAERYGQTVYLVHDTTPPQKDIDGLERRAVRVILDADSEDLLDEVERVVYHLHPTFANPDREVTDRAKRFEISTRAWGEFNLSADVYFKGYKKPLTLFRYLNFQSG